MIRRLVSLLINFLFAAGMALLLAGCGGGGGSASGSTGSLSIGITDAPVDDLYQVWVAFNGVATVNALAGPDGTPHDFELADPSN